MAFAFYLVILLGEEGSLGPAFVEGGRVFSRVGGGRGDPRSGGGVVWDREPALVPSQPLVLYTESVALEWKQVCKVAEEGLGRKPANPRLFCSKCFLDPEEGLV